MRPLEHLNDTFEELAARRVKPAYGKSPIESAREALDVPPMYRYVKETFNVPATWWDHLKINIRGHAAVYWSDRAYRVVCWLFRNIKSTRIPAVYEIYATPKRQGRVK